MRFTHFYRAMLNWWWVGLTRLCHLLAGAIGMGQKLAASMGAIIGVLARHMHYTKCGTMVADVDSS